MYSIATRNYFSTSSANITGQPGYYGLFVGFPEQWISVSRKISVVLFYIAQVQYNTRWPDMRILLSMLWLISIKFVIQGPEIPEVIKNIMLCVILNKNKYYFFLTFF